MRYIGVLMAVFFFMFHLSCTDVNSKVDRKMTAEELLQNNIDTLKSNAQKGDLIVRLNDDLISEQVKQLNETDKTYSHAGLIVERNGEKFVCHIMPDLDGADTIQLTPIDSFIDPTKNIKCALYRYSLMPIEKDSLQASLLQYKNDDVRFDKVYNLKSNNFLYCSEMIAKSLDKVTNGRIQIKDIKVPEKMKRMLIRYFRQYSNAKQMVEGSFITIDNLYLIPSCSLVTKFDLKIFPGNK